MFLIRLQLNKIMHVANKEKVTFIMKYGILTSLLIVSFLTFIVQFLYLKEKISNDICIDFFIKLLISIVPGFFMGLGEYELYEQAIKNNCINKKYKCIIKNGFLGWGLMCIVLNIRWNPFILIGVNILNTLLTYIGFSLVFGNVILMLFNPKLVHELYNVNFKGKQITRIEKRKKN